MACPYRPKRLLNQPFTGNYCMAHLPSLDNATLLDVYKRYPPLARHVLGLAEAAFTLTTEISRAEGEMLGTFVSQLNGCDYCRRVHGEAAVACGLTPPTSIEPKYGGDRWQPVFAYVRTLTLSPGSVSAEQVTALLEAGWSEEAVVQLAALVCTFNTLNRLVDGLGLSAEPEFFTAAGARLADVGYAGTVELLGLGR